MDIKEGIGCVMEHTDGHLTLTEIPPPQGHLHHLPQGLPLPPQPSLYPLFWMIHCF